MMSLRNKFFILAGLSGLLMAIVSIVSYFSAYSNLEDSVRNELITTVDARREQLNGWLETNAAVATSASNLMTALNGNDNIANLPEMLSLADGNADILELGLGNEKGFFQGRHAGNKTGQIDPRTRDWYKDGKNSGKTVFTEAYIDKFTNELVTSAVSPFKNNGQFAGTIFVDIALKTLENEVAKLNYQGKGEGIIIEKSGNILATNGESEKMTDFRKIPGLGSHFDEMLKNGEGEFVLEPINGKGESVFVYSTVEASGWIVGISVPYEYVFEAVSKLRLTFGLLTLVGLALMVFMCLKFAGKITRPIIELEAHAKELSNGNLRLKDVEVDTNDEIGSLTTAFNAMSKSLRNLISKMATTSEQVAASSEELTASAQQSADASIKVAETVGEVSGNMEQQINDIAAAKDSVDVVFNDIEQMTAKAKAITTAAMNTAEAANKGSSLMQDAIEKMGFIEKSVMTSSEVVKKLGENSKQIGQIVDAISSISEQTNLLSLNAAIEAARAGEHGKGFAVVADEVRKLAEQSQASAEQIKERIESIQQDTENAVESMETGSREVQSGTKAISEVGNQFKNIMTMVDDINSQMDGINTSVHTVSEGASRIVEAVNSIDSVSRHTAENTKTISSSTEQQSASNEEIAAASQSLANLAGDMQSAIGQFKL